MGPRSHRRGKLSLLTPHFSLLTASVGPQHIAAENGEVRCVEVWRYR